MAVDWLGSNLAEAEYFAEIEASDWSRAQNAGFSLVERSQENFQRGYPYDPDSVPIERFWPQMTLDWFISAPG